MWTIIPRHLPNHCSVRHPVRSARCIGPIQIEVFRMRPEGVPQIRRLEWIVKMVREGRLELPLCRQSWILSPVRLPVPPLSHASSRNNLFLRSRRQSAGAPDLAKYYKIHDRKTKICHSMFRGWKLTDPAHQFSATV